MLLIKAASQLAAEGLDFKIILVGDGLLRQELETAIAAFGLSEKVQITGWATGSEVQNYIINSRVFVLPSFAEGLPVVLMEALALGRPVISTYVAGIPELVEPGKHGSLVAAGSVVALKQAMRQAIQCPVTELAQMGKAGRERVVQQYNTAVEANKLGALLS
jgi:glycosyltransferase involved in cell wall biosynthesis